MTTPPPWGHSSAVVAPRSETTKRLPSCPFHFVSERLEGLEDLERGEAGGERGER